MRISLCRHWINSLCLGPVSVAKEHRHMTYMTWAPLDLFKWLATDYMQFASWGFPKPQWTLWNNFFSCVDLFFCPEPVLSQWCGVMVHSPSSPPDPCSLPEVPGHLRSSLRLLHILCCILVSSRSVTWLVSWVGVGFQMVCSAWYSSQLIFALKVSLLHNLIEKHTPGRQDQWRPWFQVGLALLGPLTLQHGNYLITCLPHNRLAYTQLRI